MSSEVRPSRWLVKKAARGGVAALSWASGSLLARRLFARQTRVRALTYHRFGDLPGDPFCVNPRAFEAQMQWLSQAGLAISLAELESFVAGARELREGSVLVTIDDGCRSLRDAALPVLLRWRIPAVAFVSAGLIGTAPGAGAAPEAYLGWEELGELRDAGVAIGSHAFNHRSLARMSVEAARAEARRSRELLEQRLGIPVQSFAYPFGTRADFGAETEQVLAECGYRSVFHSMHGAIQPGMNPLGLPRVKIEGGEGLRMFRLACAGALDAWLGVDHALWWTQQS